jgi:hypothetical protein
MIIRSVVLILLLIVAAAPFLGSQTRDVPSAVWTRLAEHAPFPPSYNFSLFSIRDTLWVMHPQGTWYSPDGISWHRSPLEYIIQNDAFLDFIFFKGTLYGLGTFNGNIERYQLTTAIHATTDMRTWKLIARESELPKRFFYHPFVFREKIWIIGGSDGTTDFSDIWTSSDAVHWDKIAEDLPFGKRSGDRFVVFRDSIYMLANDVWVSADGVRWKKRMGKIAREDLFGYAALEYDNAVWLIGCNRNQTFTSEVIVSRDGWTWESRSAPWSPRGGVAACVYRNGIIMTGGKYGGFRDGSRETEFVYSNDVWVLKKK